MNNKKLVIFSFVSLFLFGLVLNFVFGDPIADSVNNNVVVNGDGYGISNVTKGGVNATVNLSLSLTGAADSAITNITITIPGNVLVPELAQGANLTNSIASIPDWNCNNVTGDLASDNNHTEYITFWECLNSTGGAIINNTIVDILFNYTANSSVEQTVVWIVGVQNEIAGAAVNTTQLSSNIDGVVPVLVELNVSDGYTTLAKNSTIALGILTSEIETITNGTLRGDGRLTVTATISDLAFAQTLLSNGGVFLYYATNDTDVASLDYANDQNLVTTTPMTTSDTSSPYTFTGTISNLNEHNITTFVLAINDTFNNINYQNYTEDSANESYAVLTNTTNVPVLSLLNISSDGYNISVLSGGYLRPGTQMFTINAIGRDLFGASVDRDLSTDGVMIYYNTTGNLTTDVNGYVRGADAEPVVLTNNTEEGYSAVYNGSASITAGNNTNTVYYAIVANTTGNGSSTYYTLLTGQYKIDNLGPTGTAVTSNDADNRITVSGSVTFTCAATDGGAGVNSDGYVWKINSGGVDTTVTDQTDSTLALTSSSSYVNTDSAGDYIAKCTPYDSLGYIGTEGSLAFIITASSGGTSSSGGSSSGGATVISVDVDLSTSTTGSISGSVGRIRSFSFDGSTKHTVTFKEITATSAKITIASTPIDVVLSIGETKKADINSDGIDDLEVTLDNIKFGTNAEITIKKLETGAAKVVEEEKAVTETGTTQETGTTGEAAKGTGWLWITILIIIVLVTVGYYVFKKK